MTDTPDGPQRSIPSSRLVVVLEAIRFDDTYYRWCVRPERPRADEPDALPAGAPAVKDFLVAYRAEGASAERVGRTKAFTVSIVEGDTEVRFDDELGRGINSSSPQLSVLVDGELREWRVGLNILARTIRMDRDPRATDPLYPFPIVTRRSQLHLYCNELVETMRYIAQHYPS